MNRTGLQILGKTLLIQKLKKEKFHLLVMMENLKKRRKIKNIFSLKKAFYLKSSILL
jgi:hypothetical protein